MIRKVYTFFVDASKNKDALFVSNGLILPFLLFLFRIILWYTDTYIVFTAFFGIDGINRVLEPVLFCYLPTLVTFCFLSKKKSIFFFIIYQRISFLFRFFLNGSSCELFFYQNWVLGSFVSIAFVFFYLYLIYIESFLIYFRIPILCCYGSFCMFLRGPILESQSTVFPEHLKILRIRQKLEESNIVSCRVILALSNSILWAIIYRVNLIMSEHISLQESSCEDLLYVISDKISETNLFETKERFLKLDNKKIDVFDSLKKKLFLYKASLRFFGDKKEPFEEILKDIRLFYKDLF